MKRLRSKHLEVEASRVAGEDEELFLQTQTISLQEVRKSLPLWIPSLRTEIENFDNNQAIQRIEEKTKEILAEAESKGERAELIPGMAVFTRKAGDGRRRSRIVCCGNYMEALVPSSVLVTTSKALVTRSDALVTTSFIVTTSKALVPSSEARPGEEIYASGADSTQLRMILRLAALRQWHCFSLDVKSAFLLAPKAQGETVIVKPPKILEEAKLAQPGEHWLVTSAMYGLTTSPKDWSSFRDSELQKMVGQLPPGTSTEQEMGKRCFAFRPMKDPNLAIQEVTAE